ncbi:MAG: TlpA family protein disulfide reductase, partial [Elusimicrobia bacterium]|nr:TlpA family protein disulfide reductase [Elusimicrobiota bacterium]
GMTYTVLLDGDQKVGGLYGLHSLPQTFLIDRKGRVAGKWFGFDGEVEASIDEAVGRLVKGA